MKPDCVFCGKIDRLEGIFLPLLSSKIGVLPKGYTFWQKYKLSRFIKIVLTFTSRLFAL